MFRRLLTVLLDSFIYGSGNALGQVISLLLLPLYTKYLTPGDYGILSMLALVPAVFLTLAAAGMKTALFREFYRLDDPERRGKVLGTALATISGTAAVLLAIGVLLAEPLAAWLLKDASVAPIVRLSLLASMIGAVGEVPRGLLQATRRVKTTTIINVLMLLITIACTIYFVVALQWGVMGVIYGRLIGQGVSTASSFGFTFRNFSWTFDISLWKKMSSFALPYLPHRLLAMAMDNMDDFLVIYLLGKEQAGLYYVAIRIAAPIGIASAALEQAWAPYKYKVYAEDANPASFFRSAFTYLSSANLYLWLGISVWGPELVRSMTDPKFHPAANLIWAVALIRTCRSFCPLLATGVELGESSRWVPLTSLAGLITVALGCFLLMPILGPIGAALSASLAWLAMGAGYYIISQRQVKIKYDWFAVAAAVGVAGTLVYLGQSAQELPVLLRLSAALGISLCYPLAMGAALWWSSSEHYRMVRLWQGLSALCGLRRSVEMPATEPAQKPPLA